MSSPPNFFSRAFWYTSSSICSSVLLRANSSAALDAFMLTAAAPLGADKEEAAVEEDWDAPEPRAAVVSVARAAEAEDDEDVDEDEDETRDEKSVAPRLKPSRR